MGRSFPVLILAGVIVVVASAAAQDRGRQRAVESWDLESPPLLFNAGQVTPEGISSWLTMRCEGDEPRYLRMHCTFEHTSIWQPAEEAVRERMAEFDRDSAGLRTRDLVPWRRECGNDPHVSSACPCFVQADDHRPVEDERACFVRVHRERAEARATACRVHHGAFELDLERVSRTRWMGTLRSLLCGNVTAIVLDATDNLRGWTYTQTRVTVDDSSDPLCGGLQAGAVTRFASNAPDYFPATCSGFVPSL